MSTNQNQLALEITGPEDAPVLVLGSSLGADRHMWDEIVPLLDGWRIVRYDHPGHGQSAPLSLPTAAAQTCPVSGQRGENLGTDNDAEDVPRHASPADHADALARSLAAAGIEKFHLAGLSLGGMMTLWWAANRPTDILSATVMCAGPVIEPSEAWWDKAQQVRSEGTGAIVEATLERWFTPSFLEENGPLVQRTRQTYLQCSDEGFAQCCEIIATMDNRPDLDRIEVPVGFICAEFDQSLPPRDAHALGEEIHQRAGVPVKVEEVSDAAHLAAVEQPAAVAAALTRILEHHRS